MNVLKNIKNLCNKWSMNLKSWNYYTREFVPLTSVWLAVGPDADCDYKFINLMQFISQGIRVQGGGLGEKIVLFRHNWCTVRAKKQ